MRTGARHCIRRAMAICAIASPLAWRAARIDPASARGWASLPSVAIAMDELPTAWQVTRTHARRAKLMYSDSNERA